MMTPGCVAFWDFMKREPDGARRFSAHVPAGALNDFPLDAGNYVRVYWGEGREATYADFPLLGRGPFGQAIRIRKEEDATFRPFLFVPRARLHDSPIDVKGAGRSVSVVVGAIRVVFEDRLVPVTAAQVLVTSLATPTRSSATLARWWRLRRRGPAGC
jgi:hypothetical protein